MSNATHNAILRRQLLQELERERHARWLLPEWPNHFPDWAPQLAKSRWRNE